MTTQHHRLIKELILAGTLGPKLQVKVLVGYNNQKELSLADGVKYSFLLSPMY